MDKYYIKDGYKLRCIANNYIVVAVGKASKEFNGMINLNASGAFLWKSLEKLHTKEELLQAIQNEYDVESDVAKKDIDLFIATLEKNGIIQ